MGLIPWRNKQDVPVRKEETEMQWPLADFRREMDSLFDNFFRDPWSMINRTSDTSSFSSWLPSVDVSEDEKEVKVAMEVPGIDTNDLDISLNGNTLTVKGEKREEKENKGKDFYRSERRFGSFKRSVELPRNADPESVKADYKNGILSITALKKGGETSKRIPILNE